MVELRLEAIGPFNHRAVLAMLTAHAVPGVEAVDGAVYRRLISDGGGSEARPVLIELVFDPHGLTARFDAELRDPHGTAAMLRRWFDLDADIAAIDAALSPDPLLGPMIARHPGVRITGHPDEFEAVAAAIIGQQVSLAAARTFSSRLAAAFGAVAGAWRSLPTAAALADAGPERIRSQVGLTGARARALHEVAKRWAGGPLLAGTSAAEAREALLAIPGVGPWTADCLLVRAMQHPDTFVPGDLVARRALGMDQKQAAARSETWAPYRSYALLQLWTHASYL
ncbi:hypothetical protein NHL51_10715 [Leucobacter sp. gxy201]|uniref:DNA-3-methyladenine glycosylase family protein n=1 Tax=Leucobacter sp. gxy201 TaxID=2957200 RepID=UPI003DA166AE